MKQLNWGGSESQVRFLLGFTLACGIGCSVGGWQAPLLAQTATPTPQASPSPNPDLDLPAGTLEQSPVLRRWLEKPPDVLDDIRRDPSFPTRIQVGPTRSLEDERGGFAVGVEDVFVGRTGLTFSSQYQQTGDDSRLQAHARYYLLPLGSRFNFAPQVGYGQAYLQGDRTSGVDIGYKVILVLSRGSSDINFSQSWIKPGSDNETRLTRVGVGYALTRDLRLATDFQWQRTGERSDRRAGLLLEWTP
ncbi:hypothetical protein [Leptolyngbya sp. FACHB-261]|uniref:hypothetical protein n=1 Tax=Leptolyngbya sp. FACHB-261 TaxID=2692806 RepID=UPI00168642B4|nr:hypothetical protein [Leptolyngbya sp. FACHB-261]MBD2104528.1 hypothetical protein [Leptolyngbya sp. FACHB-261]